MVGLGSARGAFVMDFKKSMKAFSCLVVAAAELLCSGGSLWAKDLKTFEARSAGAQEQSSRTYILTLDACGGEFDWELAKWLESHKVPSTIFVTKAFIDANPMAVSYLKDRKDLFDIQNHGGKHHAPIEEPGSIWGVKQVGSREGLDAEVLEGAKSIKKAFGSDVKVYRGATAVYSAGALDRIGMLGYEVGGYSVSLDAGGVLGANQIMGRALSAKPGDVLLGHINRPRKHNGLSIAAALQAMLDRGDRFESWIKAGPKMQSRTAGPK